VHLAGYNFVADIMGLSSFVYSRCFFPKLQNREKFRHNLTLQQFKVIQGHRFWY